MKVVFIPAKSSVDVRLSAAALKRLPKQRYGIVSTVQHLDRIVSVQKQLPDSVIAGQVLGCNALRAEDVAEGVDAFLYVGTGEFHPLYVAYKTKRPVWIWNPVSKRLSELDAVAVKEFAGRRQALFSKFFAADNVGILVSLKPGQLNFERARVFAARKDKNYYLFISDTLDLSELENFPFIDCWINAACPRISDDVKGIINLDDLVEFLKLDIRPGRTIWTVRP